MSDLMHQCREYLDSLGFVDIGSTQTKMHNFDKSHEIIGKYAITIHEILGDAEYCKAEKEIEGSVIVYIKKIPKDPGPKQPKEYFLIGGMVVESIQQFKYLVEGTRTWRFMQLGRKEDWQYALPSLASA